MCLRKFFPFITVYAVNKQDRKTLSKTFLPAKSKLKRSNMLHIMAHWLHIISQLKVCDIARIKLISIEDKHRKYKESTLQFNESTNWSQIYDGIIVPLNLAKSSVANYKATQRDLINCFTYLFTRVSPVDLQHHNDLLTIRQHG
jgi:hypothetical protein